MRHGCRSILPLAARKIGQNASRQPIIPPFGDKKRGAVKKPKVFSQPLVAGEQASPPYTPPGTIEARKGFGSTIRNSRLAALPLATLLPLSSAWSLRVFAPPCADACAVFRGCALRFASCARHSSPSGLRRSQAHSRCSLLHWAHRRLLHPQFAMVVLLRPTACSTPLLIGLTTACFAHCARPSCAPLAAPPLSPSLDFRFACFRHWRRRSSVPLALSLGFLTV